MAERKRKESHLFVSLSPHLSHSFSFPNTGLLHNTARIWAQLQLPPCTPNPAQGERKCKSAARLNTPKHTYSVCVTFSRQTFTLGTHWEKQCISSRLYRGSACPQVYRQPKHPKTALFCVCVYVCLYLSGTLHTYGWWDTHMASMLSAERGEEVRMNEAFQLWNRSFIHLIQTNWLTARLALLDKTTVDCQNPKTTWCWFCWGPGWV